MSTEWRDDKSDSTAITPAPPAPSTPKPKKAANGGDVETGSGVEVSGVVHDAVFGDIVEHGPNFRAVNGWGAFVLMTKANLGLGVLAIPVVFSTLGIVPGIIVIVVIEAILMYCASFLGPFKIAHPEVYGLADAGYVFGGRWGKEIFYGIFSIFMVFCTASAIVGVSTALNAMSSHGACTAIFLAVAAIAGFLLGSIRTLGKVSWVGWAGITSVMVSIVALTIAVGVQERPSEAPRTGPWDKKFQVVGTPTFAGAMTAINIILFSSSATPMYFGVLSEMRDPRQYTKAMCGSLTFLTCVYLIIGSVVYHFCGQYVASPALGSAGILMKKVCYGLAFPGLLASLTIFNHISAKHLFVRILSGSKHLTANSWTHWGTWLGCTAGSVIVAYVIASAIPVFGSLIDFIGALLCPLVAIIPELFMWWHDNIRTREAPLTRRLKIQLAVNCVLLVAAAYLTVAGTYAAIVELIHTSVSTGPWTCANNSGRLD